MRLIFLLVFLITSNTLFAEKLIIGTRPFIPPFEMMASNNQNFSGFEIELMLEICKRIQADCEFRPRTFLQLFTDILAMKIDLAISVISITDNRMQQFLFSIPYFESSSQYLAKSTSKIASVEDIRGKRAGVEMGTTAKSVVQNRFHDNVTIYEYKTTQDLLQALDDDKIDVFLSASDFVNYWANNNQGYKLIDTPTLDGSGYGIMAHPSRTDLINRINSALLAMQNDGTYVRLYQQYFMRFAQ